jgi:hypothetical protein
VVRKLGIKGIYLNIIKTIHDKPIANIKLNEEKLKPFLLKSGMSQRYPLSPQEEEIKGRIQLGKEVVKVSLFADDMILYLKDPKHSNKNSRHHQ